MASDQPRKKLPQFSIQAECLLRHYTVGMRRVHFKATGLAVPDPQPIAQALQSHQGLARLGLLLQESNRRMAIIAPALPGPLGRHVKPGPIDEEGWSLLAANAAIAAKLRYLQPRLEAMIEAEGLSPSRIRIKVLQG